MPVMKVHVALLKSKVDVIRTVSYMNYGWLEI